MKQFRIITLLAILVMVVAACSTSTLTTDSKNGAENSGIAYSNYNAEQFKELIADESVFVLDTHIPEQAHIKGTDDFIPYNELAANMNKLPEDKNTPIAVYCRSGSMSVSASKELIAMGYTNVYNLLGGANAWRSSGYEFE